MGKYSKEKLLNKFLFECKNLSQDFDQEPPREMDYYLNIAEKCCDLSEICKIQIFHLRTVYINFINLVKDCIEKEREPNEEEILFFREKVFYNSDDEKTPKYDPNATKVAPNIILIAPPGFIDIENLRKFCEEKNIVLDFGIRQKGSELPTLRICTPSQFNLKSSKVKIFTYCLVLKINEIDVNNTIESISEKYKNYSESDKFKNLFSKEKNFYQEIFNNDFVYKNLVNKIGFECLKLGRCKQDKGFYYLEDYTQSLNPYEFNLQSLDVALNQIFSIHKKKF